MTPFEAGIEDLADDAEEERGISMSWVKSANRSSTEREKESDELEARSVQRGSTIWERRRSITIDYVFLRREVSFVRD